jgi:hypothetical protein
LHYALFLLIYSSFIIVVLSAAAKLRGIKPYRLPPNKKTGEFSAAVSDVEKGIIFHECIEGDIDVSGWWVFWAFITFGDGRTAAGEAAKVYVWNEGR